MKCNMCGKSTKNKDVLSFPICKKCAEITKEGIKDHLIACDIRNLKQAIIELCISIEVKSFTPELVKLIDKFKGDMVD